MISFNWEYGWDKFYNEAENLLRAHFTESASHKEILDFNNNHEAYRQLEKAGRLLILIVREEGAIVGYLTLITGPCPRDIAKTMIQDDIIYSVPRLRKKLIGYKMIAYALNFAKISGFRIAALREKATKNGRARKGGFLRRLGFLPEATIWTIDLEKYNGPPV
jgi:GNAT superfamily N-acetyltransferase